MPEKNHVTDKKRLLIIDDEEGMRLGIERVLRRFAVDIPHLDRALEFSIHQAESGEEGLKMIKDLSPHILLLDNKLPGMSGIEILTAISEMEIDEPVKAYFPKKCQIACDQHHDDPDGEGLPARHVIKGIQQPPAF